MNILFGFYVCECLLTECEKGTPQKTIMGSQEQFVQQFIRLFKHYTEALSPAVSREDRLKGPDPREDRNRLVAAARLAILELETNALIQADSRRYFAKPGEAEWGC